MHLTLSTLPAGILAFFQHYVALIWIASNDFAWYLVDETAKIWMREVRCQFPSLTCIRKAKMASHAAHLLRLEREECERNNRLASAEMERLDQEKEEQQQQKDIISKAKRFDELTKENFTLNIVDNSVTINNYNDYRSYHQHCPQMQPTEEWQAGVSARTVGEPYHRYFNTSSQADINEVLSIMHPAFHMFVAIFIFLACLGLLSLYKRVLAAYSTYYATSTNAVQVNGNGTPEATSAQTQHPSSSANATPVAANQEYRPNHAELRKRCDRVDDMVRRSKQLGRAERAQVIETPPHPRTDTDARVPSKPEQNQPAMTPVIDDGVFDGDEVVDNLIQAEVRRRMR